MRLNFFLTLASVMVLLLAGVKGSDAQMTVAQPVQAKSETEAGIRFFEGTWEDALAESKKTGKPVFMDCYTGWCVPCKMLAKEVFTRPEVGDYFNARFINVKMDMETKQGKVLNDKYKVTGYPTLLFMDGDGNLQHRIVGAPAANILLKEGARAVDGKGYSPMNKAYAEGNRQPDFIQEYMEVLDVAGEGGKAAQICLDYFKMLDKSKLKERGYWDLFCKYVKDVDADISKYVYKNRVEFTDLFGEKAVDKKLYQLHSGAAYRYWKKEGDSGAFDEKGFENYVRQLMKKDIRQKEQIIADARMFYAMNLEDWQKYVQLGTERLNAGEVNDFIVYNWALKVNVLCKDMAMREKAAQWMERVAVNCDSRPQSDATTSLKNNFLRVADLLRHPEKNDKNYRPTIAITGKVAALSDENNIIRIIKRDGFFKQMIDSCEIKPDGSYDIKMRVENPGMYILECQGGQRVDFWAGDENLKVDFPGFGKVKIRVIRPMYIHIHGGKNNEVINRMNWEIYQNYQLMGTTSRPVYNYPGLADTVKQQIALELAGVANKDMYSRLQHCAELYADREAVLAILMRLKGEEYEATVKKVVENLSKLYPRSLALNDFKAVLVQRELAKQGQVAPDFSCPTPDGKKNLGPQDFKGKFLVMDFWASWCGPCRAEIPHLKEAYAKYADKGVAFFSVSIDKNDAAWKKALGEENMPWEQVCAPQAGKDVMRQYQFSGIPYVLVLDKEGRIVGTNLRGKALMDKLEELVKGNKPKAKSSTMMMTR